MNVAAGSGQQVRPTFTSAEVGNRPATEVGTLADPDGGLALRLQAENGSDSLAGLVGRYDKGIRNVSTAPGVTFDLRDLVGGAQRGAAFKMGVLRTKGAAGATGSTGEGRRRSAGRDVFAFVDASGRERILDVVSGTDRINLWALGVEADDVEATALRADRLLGINVSGGDVAGAQVRLMNAGAPPGSGFLFG